MARRRYGLDFPPQPQKRKGIGSSFFLAALQPQILLSSFRAFAPSFGRLFFPLSPFLLFDRDQVKQTIPVQKWFHDPFSGESAIVE